MDKLPESFFISVDKVEEREIELADGSKHVFHFKHLSNTWFEKFSLWSNSASEDVAATASARLLVAGMCKPDGGAAMSLDQAVRLKRSVMQSLVSALLDVNGYGKAAEQGNQ